jgi:uncharacterized membrane protein YeaQ/YmgE (transglycosylase-associated protein family)
MAARARAGPLIAILGSPDRNSPTTGGIHVWTGGFRAEGQEAQPPLWWPGGKASPNARRSTTVIGTIIGAIIAGLVIGALARLVLPGKQNISVLVTIVLGVLGSLIGSWLVYQIGYNNSNGGFEIIPFIAGIVVAAILIMIYSSVTGRKTSTR